MSVECSGFRVSGSGVLEFMASGFWFTVEVSKRIGFMVQCSGLRIQGVGFEVQGLGFRVSGLGFRA